MKKEDRDEFREILSDTFKPLAKNVNDMGVKVEALGIAQGKLETKVDEKFTHVGNCSQNTAKIQQNEQAVGTLHERANALSNRLWGIIISSAGVAILLVIWFIKAYYSGK